MQHEITIPAKKENMPVVTDFLTSHLENAGVAVKQIYAINTAADEIFSNIAKYAYPHDTGDVMIRLETDTDGVQVTFTDEGEPFDPLEMPEPDITLSAQDREIGGLGILMVKKLMDETVYSYENGKNILTVLKKTITENKRE